MCIRDSGQIDYTRINHELEMSSMERVGEILMLPYFQGRSTPDWNPDSKAVFEGIALKHTRPEILQSLVEGIFLEIANNLQAVSYTHLDVYKRQSQGSVVVIGSRRFIKIS